MGIPIFAVLVYNLAIARTIQLRNDLLNLEYTINESKGAPEKIAQYQKELGALNARLKTYEFSDQLNQEKLLAEVSKLCKSYDLTITEVPIENSHQAQDLLIYTNRFEIEGGFKSMVKLIYDLEQKHQCGRLSSCRFELIKDRERKKELLVLELFIQNIKKA